MTIILEHADLILHGIDSAPLSVLISDLVSDKQRVRCIIRQGGDSRCQVVIDKLIQGDSIVGDIIDRIRALDGVTIAKIDTQ